MSTQHAVMIVFPWSMLLLKQVVAVAVCLWLVLSCDRGVLFSILLTK